MSDSSCSNLIKHASICLRKQAKVQKNSNLANHGIKGTGDINPKEVSKKLCIGTKAELRKPIIKWQFHRLHNSVLCGVLRPQGPFLLLPRLAIGQYFIQQLSSTCQKDEQFQGTFTCFTQLYNRAIVLFFKWVFIFHSLFLEKHTSLGYKAL